MQVSLQQAAARLPELAQLAANGEHIVIVADGLPDLELTVASPKPARRQAGALKHAITIIDENWDKPSEEVNAEFFK